MNALERILLIIFGVHVVDQVFISFICSPRKVSTQPAAVSEYKSCSFLVLLLEDFCLIGLEEENLLSLDQVTVLLIHLT